VLHAQFFVQVVTGLHAAFMRLVHECVEDVPLMKALGLSDTAVSWLQWSAKCDHSPVMGRMDFVLADYDPATGSCVPKLLEYNGDTPGTGVCVCV
jgi:glutathionylspermidine synthase